MREFDAVETGVLVMWTLAKLIFVKEPVGELVTRHVMEGAKGWVFSCLWQGVVEGLK